MKSPQEENQGLAGRLAEAFVQSRLTPLLVLAALLLGLLAIVATPREEEPQIQVPMIDVLIPFPGASPREVEERVTLTAEKLLWGIPGVEYLYSISRSSAALITVRFQVGSDLEQALIKVHHKCQENIAERPAGVGQPLIKAYTIDDVPFLALTIHSPLHQGYELRRLAQELRRVLAETPNVSRVELSGGQPRQIKIEPDPQKLAARDISLGELFLPLSSGNIQGPVGSTKGVSPEWLIDFDAFFDSAEAVGKIVVGIKAGRPVLLQEVARVSDGPAQRTSAVLYGKKGGALENAVTLSFAKRPGTNASDLARRLIAHAQKLKGQLLPGDVGLEVSRDYGRTAKEKSDELIFHLLLASLSVCLLIALFLGLRFALVVGVAIPVTLALTLLIYYLFGYTLNRVTLFALIFSIGILVDDAIVVVENVHRHLHHERHHQQTFRQIVVHAVSEVGNPTILATFAVIAAILPMGFVRGLMGPYMRPIPVGASLAMLFSLAIAFIVTPWATRRFYRMEEKPPAAEKAKADSPLDRLYFWIMKQITCDGRHLLLFFGAVALLFLLAVSLLPARLVRVKMLPFDNKSELQIMIDLEEGKTLEDTLAVGRALTGYLGGHPQVVDYQVYAGCSAPVNFNGLVRHYFLRRAPHQGDIQVNLVDRHRRQVQSHDIAKAMRQPLTEIGQQLGARIKVVEIPPGPPVLSTLVAEIYGPEQQRQIEIAAQLRRLFQQTPGVVDVDWLVERPQPKYRIAVNRDQASLTRVPVDRIYQVVQAAIGGTAVGVLHAPEEREQVPLWLQLPQSYRGDIKVLNGLQVVSLDGSFVPLRRLIRAVPEQEAQPIYHKNLKRVVYVISELAGREESPVYALLQLNKKIDALQLSEGYTLKRYASEQPQDTDRYSLKWDGEWQITYEVFRDLGIAFAVVLMLIYVLVVGWFESFLVPLVIMIPIPLSLVGILPAHWLTGAFFTATSMIGFIAGAGIIVRNSIILVDFIELRIKQGMEVRQAVIDAGAVRFRPMLLTAAAVVVGAGVILFDPIFQGLALSLMAGEVAATALSRFAVPVLYYVLLGHNRQRLLRPASCQSGEDTP